MIRMAATPRVAVAYPGGFPDFAAAGLVKAEVDIGTFVDRSTDFAKANRKMAKPANTTWHHHEDGKTLQAVDTNAHREFTHQGGISLLGEK